MVVGRGVWIGIALAVVFMLAVSAYTVLRSPERNCTNSQTSSSQGAGATQSSSTEPVQEGGTVTCIDSGGGHFSITNVGFDIQSISGGPGTMVVALSSGQASLLQYGQDVDTRMTYTPLQRVVFDSLGKVIGLSNAVLTIALLNSTMPNTISASWNPKMGDQVILIIGPETGAPLVAITGLALNGPTQFATLVDSPACFRQRGAALAYGDCAVKAGQPFELGLSFSVYPPCYGPLHSCTLSVTTSDSGFSVSGVQPYKIGSGVTITLATPRTDFIGDIPLTFAFIGS